MKKNLVKALAIAYGYYAIVYIGGYFLGKKVIRPMIFDNED